MSMTMLVDKKEIHISNGVLTVFWKETIGIEPNTREAKARTVVHLNKTECLALSVGLKNEAPER